MDNQWSSIIEMLLALNKIKCKTLVLRNFEKLEDDELISGHEDIDLLCDNSDEVIAALHAFPRGDENDKTHLAVCIAGNRIDIDLRVVGDSYYDSKWEMDMLERRIQTARGYYIPNTIDYIYSLLYHGFFHKPNLKQEYAERIINLAKENRLEIEEDHFMQYLQKYMDENGYIDTGYKSR